MDLEVVPSRQEEFRNKERWRDMYLNHTQEDIQSWYGRASDYKGLLEYFDKGTDKENTASGQKSCVIVGDTIPDLAHSISSGLIYQYVEDKTKSTGLSDQIRFNDLTELYEWDGEQMKDPHMIIDNGYVDRVCHSSDSPTSQVTKYFQHISTHFGQNTSFIIISLGHDIVIAEIIRYYRDKEYSLTCYPLDIAQDYDCCMPFITVITKKAHPHIEGQGNQKMLGISGSYYSLQSKLPDYLSIYQFFRFTREARRIAFYERKVSEYHEGKLIFMSVLSSSQGASNRTVHYGLTLYDRVFPTMETNKRRAMLRLVKPTVAILVSLADQHHWLYKTIHGHQKLAEKADARRIILVFLREFDPFKDNTRIIQKFKEDLAQHLMNLSVDKEHPVLLMTQQQTFSDDRVEVHKEQTQFSGEIFVFDGVVDTDDEEWTQSPSQSVNANAKPSKYRRRTMVFRCNPRMAQTEIWYQKKDNGKKIYVQPFHISHAYHIFILAGIFSSSLFTSYQIPQKLHGAVLGLGGGMLSTLLFELFEGNLSLDNVEIDPVVAKVTKEHFGFTESENNKLFVQDAITFIQQKVSEKQPQLYDLIVVDINATQDEIMAEFDGTSCPPPPFLKEDFLRNAASLLSPKGLLLINSITYTDRGRQKISSLFKSVFSRVSSYRYKEDMNEVFMCTNDTSSVDDTGLPSRKICIKAAQKLRNVDKMINLTPMYLGKKSDFPHETKIW